MSSKPTSRAESKRCLQEAVNNTIHRGKEAYRDIASVDTVVLFAFMLVVCIVVCIVMCTLTVGRVLWRNISNIQELQSQLSLGALMLGVLMGLALYRLQLPDACAEYMAERQRTKGRQGLPGLMARLVCIVAYILHYWASPLLVVCAFTDFSLSVTLGVALGRAAWSLFVRSGKPPPPEIDPNTGKKMFRVVLAGDAFFPKVDGVATFARYASEMLVENHHHSVHLLCSIPGPSPLHGCSVTRFPGFTPKACLSHKCTVPVPAVLSELVRLQPHVVHLFEMSLFTLVMTVYCCMLDIPVVLSHHTRLDMYANVVIPEMPAWFNQGALKLFGYTFFPLCDANINVCSALLNSCRERVGPRADVRLWHSGSDTAFTPTNQSDEMRMRLSKGRPDLPLLLHLGRLSLEKNSYEIPAIVDRAIKLFGGQVRVAIVGDGQERVTIEDELKAMGHHDKVNFTGFLQGEELRAAFASCDIFFSPSCFEAFPLVYLEAMRSGLSVVGPDSGGVPDTFEDGVQGRLHPAHDTVKAADAIFEVYQKGKTMRAAALEHAQKFTWKNSIAELDDVLSTHAQRRLRKNRAMEFLPGVYELLAGEKKGERRRNGSFS